MNGVREVCHCNCDKASHYLDQSVTPHERATCLSCEGCKRYVYVGDPKPGTRLEKLDHPAKYRGGVRCECECYRCKEWRAQHVRQAFPAVNPAPLADDSDDDGGPITLPMMPAWPSRVP